MKIPTVECPRCKAQFEIKILDEDIVKMLAQRLGVEIK